MIDTPDEAAPFAFTLGFFHAFRSHQKRGDQKHSNDGHPRRRPKPPRRRPSSSENPTDHQFHFASERAAAFTPPAHHTGELGQQDPQPCVARETVFYSTSRTSAALRRVRKRRLAPPATRHSILLHFTSARAAAFASRAHDTGGLPQPPFLESKRLCFT